MTTPFELRPILVAEPYRTGRRPEHHSSQRDRAPRLREVGTDRVLDAQLVAAIYDVHGNVAALDAVLAEIERMPVDLVVVGGDIAWGPFPREAIHRIRDLALPTVAIRGNADREVATRAGRADGLDEVESEINGWCADQIDEDDRRWLLGLPTGAVVNVSGMGPVLFCHGSPRSDDEPLTRDTPSSRLNSALEGVDEAVVVCGHTHVQMDRRDGARRIVNPGSVGLPFEGRPGAYWALLGPDLNLKRTRYDENEVAQLMAASGCPHAEEVFCETLRRPPAPDEAVAMSEKSAANRF